MRKQKEIPLLFFLSEITQTKSVKLSFFKKKGQTTEEKRKLLSLFKGKPTYFVCVF